MHFMLLLSVLKIDTFIGDVSGSCPQVWTSGTYLHMERRG